VLLPHLLIHLCSSHTCLACSQRPKGAVHEEEKEQPNNQGEILNEYMNVRAIHWSVKHINAATASGHRPHLYHLAETWWETDTHPTLEEYTIIACSLAEREFVKGRAKGGIAIYKHNDCTMPTLIIPLSAPEKGEEPIKNAIATAIGTEDEGSRIR
jgi:hypothetical protein